MAYNARCPDCSTIHEPPRCMPPPPPFCTGSYTNEYAVTLAAIMSRPRVWWEPRVRMHTRTVKV